MICALISVFNRFEKGLHFFLVRTTLIAVILKKGALQNLISLSFLTITTFHSRKLLKFTLLRAEGRKKVLPFLLLFLIVELILDCCVLWDLEMQHMLNRKKVR